MNKTRRKATEKLEDRLQAFERALYEMTEKPLNLDETLKSLHSDLDDIKNEIETLRDEEQESLDNLPESLSGSDKANDMQEAIGNYDDAMNVLSELIDSLDNFPGIVETLSEAISRLNDARYSN